MEPFRSDGAVILRRNRAVLAIPALGVVAGLVLVALGWLRPDLEFVIGQLLVLGGFLGLSAAFAFNPLRQSRRVTLEADASGVRADGVPLLSRANISEGYVQPDSEGPTVKLRGRRLGRGLEVRLGSAEEAQALLRTLHLDAAQAKVTFWAPSPLVVSLPLQLLVGVAWIAVFILTMNVVHLGMGPAVLLYALLYLIPKRVVAGSDGVRIGWLGPGKFVPYANVAHASLDDRGDVVIDLRNGARVRLLFRQPFRSSSTMNSFDLLTTLFARQKTAIVERIEEAARAHERGVADRDAGGVLARGGRTAVEWLKALHSLGSGAVNYRSVTLPPDVLWRIAENPAAPPHERAAAAVALRDALDEEGRARLRVLAEATAAPRVRVALEAAASATDDETLARALDECEGDTPEKRRHAGRAAG